ncbi:hypothetical protein CANCADRAFT_3659 [Tortispora caseinolytica NRRL Y-17796]|uniref:Anaphase-promoting complex subunit 4 WD40 domain-containing protein n=1 Tax=Tortispora caseinolytica NRRL Y-17796 TaxID=767744 RepID=A0A1E4TB84_9ASCO|nr:hypothetical protein CANCADRAFT_3659 [Tortispora caseinolytica NRRL Y-17796]
MAQATILEPHNAAVSAVRFNPFDEESHYLISSSWDGSIKLYDHHANISAATVKTNAPLLDCGWEDTGVAITGGLDRRLYRIDLSTGNISAIARHEHAIKSVLCHRQTGSILSGSWDHTVQALDSRSGEIFAHLNLPGKVFSMDFIGSNTVAVAMSERHIYLYDLRDLREPLQRRISSLSKFTRCIRGMPSVEGYAVSSIDGRVAIEFLDPREEIQAQTFAFKSHREAGLTYDTAYPINALAFQGTTGNLLTGGSDNQVILWDLSSRKKIKSLPKFGDAVQSLDTDASGRFFAAGLGSGAEVGKQTSEGSVIVCAIPERKSASTR